MSRDREHEKLMGRLNLIVKAMGMKWVKCPNDENTADDDGMYGTCRNGHDTCVRDNCYTCEGSGVVLREKQKGKNDGKQGS